MKRIMLCLCAITFMVSADSSNAQPMPKISAPLVTEPAPATILTEAFGSAVESVAQPPTVLRGDFNGDGFQDLAIIVQAKGKRGDLKSGVQFVDMYVGEKMKDTPQSAFQKNISLAVVYGTATGWKNLAEHGKLLLYGINSAGWNGDQTGKLQILTQAKQKRDKTGYVQISPENYVRLPAGVKGDAIVVPTEAGINVPLFFNGKSFAFYFDPDDSP